MEWNQTDQAYPAEESIHDRFEAQAARTPEATAAATGVDYISVGALTHSAPAADISLDVILDPPQ